MLYADRNQRRIILKNTVIIISIALLSACSSQISEERKAEKAAEDQFNNEQYLQEFYYVDCLEHSKNPDVQCIEPTDYN